MFLSLLTDSGTGWWQPSKICIKTKREWGFIPCAIPYTPENLPGRVQLVIVHVEWDTFSLGAMLVTGAEDGDVVGAGVSVAANYTMKHHNTV